MEPDPPRFPFEDWEEGTEEDWADGAPELVNWSTIDQELFGADWIREMEALDIMPTTELYDGSTSDGFLQNDWQQAQEAMENVLNSFGCVSPKLLGSGG